jgi:hypothetical protein
MSTCSKISYQSPNAAFLAMRAIIRKAPVGKRVPVDFYHCEQCSAWHLTSHGKPRWIIRFHLAIGGV